MQTCTTGKRCYLTIELAEEALIGAHINFNYGKGARPVGIYQCDDCGLFHLTSQGVMNKRLALMIEEGDIQKQKEARWWEDKFKKW